MYAGSWIEHKAPNLVSLLKCYIKISFPDLENGSWNVRRLQELLETRVSIVGIESTLKLVIYRRTCDVFSRREAREYGVSRSIMMTPYSRKGIVCWLPLTTFTDELEEMVMQYKGQSPLNEFEAMIGLRFIDDVSELCILDDGETVAKSNQPIVVLVETLDSKSNDIIKFQLEIMMLNE